MCVSEILAAPRHELVVLVWHVRAWVKVVLVSCRCHSEHVVPRYVGLSRCSPDFYKMNCIRVLQSYEPE
jgi:hypothetical protein